ncbi:MAG: asparagine synthetase B family protein [Anaerolineae bacterium]|jgi:asparagine synthase (glutamine-hydrolysing)
MSGLFGILDYRNRADIPHLLQIMARRMTHQSWYVVETEYDESRGAGLGRIGIGLLNREAQPVYSAGKSLSVWLCGEFYGTADLRIKLEKELGAPVGDGDGALALALYRYAGDDMARHLEGAFILAVWDRALGRLLVANDRHGLYPLYYAHYAGRLALAPEMKGILCDASFRKELNPVALAEYMRFQSVLGDKTFFEGIRLFPPASTLSYDIAADELRIQPYWSPGEIPENRLSFDEAVEEAGRLFRRAVNRLAAGPLRPGVYLSGGLDSRAILGVIEPAHYPVATLTYGKRGCRDVVYAERIARKAGSDHHWADLPDGRWVLEHVDLHMALTEGSHSWIHAHGISTLKQARELMDVNLSGWDGGTIMGDEDTTAALLCRAVSEQALATQLFFLFNQKYTWPSLTEAEEYLLYTDAIRPTLLGLAFESFRAELAPYLDYRPDVRVAHFYIHNHCRRMTQAMITVARSHIEARFPFFDYQLFDFLHSLPALIRGHRRLYRAMLQRECPRLMNIPYDHDEMLPTTRPLIRGVHGAVVRIKRRVNRHVRPIFARRPTLYADYEAYLRGELRSWAEGILFDRRTAERGIFDPAFLRTLMDRHLSGLEEWIIGKIAPIMTYEMMLRALYDKGGEDPSMTLRPMSESMLSTLPE